MERIEQGQKVQLQVSDYFDYRFKQLDKQQELIYSTLVKICEKLDVDLTEDDVEEPLATLAEPVLNNEETTPNGVQEEVKEEKTDEN